VAGEEILLMDCYVEPTRLKGNSTGPGSNGGDRPYEQECKAVFLTYNESQWYRLPESGGGQIITSPDCITELCGLQSGIADRFVQSSPECILLQREDALHGNAARCACF